MAYIYIRHIYIRHTYIQHTYIRHIYIRHIYALPDPGIGPASFMSPGLANMFFTISATGEAPSSLGELR